MLSTSPRACRAPDYSRCCHLTLAGARCTMPALRDKDLCFRHNYRARVPFKPAVPDLSPRAPLVNFVYMENHDDVMANLNAIADGFARHAIHHAEVSAATYLMNTVLKTLKQMSQIETKITAEEIARDVVYNDLGQPRAVDPQPEPQPEVPTEAVIEPQPAPTNDCHPEEATETPDHEQAGAPFLPGVGRSGPARERPPFSPVADQSTAEESSATTPQPTRIQTLNAKADPNPIVSHIYENNKKQPQSFHTHAENKSRGRG